MVDTDVTTLNKVKDFTMLYGIHSLVTGGHIVAGSLALLL